MPVLKIDQMLHGKTDIERCHQVNEDFKTLPHSLKNHFNFLAKREIILGGPDLTNENAQNGDWTGLLK